MKEHYNHWLPRLFKANAIVFGSHIFYDHDNPSVFLRRHEREHVRQYQEHGFFGFLFRYLLEYASGRLYGLDHRKAYLQISFEVKARKAETVR